MSSPTVAQILLTADDKTRAAFAAVGRNVGGLQDKVKGLGAGFLGLKGQIAAVLAGIGAVRNIGLLDQLDDLSEKTGISVEKLSELRYAGEVVGTPLEALAGGVGRLSKLMAQAASGNKEAASSFKALGVQVRNSDGSLRGSDEVLGDLADRFASYEDGAAKAAWAQQIFGKSGAEMIPLLNRGRSGIESLRKEAEQLGAIYSGQLAQDAAAFNDNLAKLKIASEAAAISLGGPLIASLKDVTTFFLEARKEGSLLQALLVTLGAGVARVLGKDEVGQAKARAADAASEMERLQRVMQGVQLTLERDPGNAVAQRRMATLRAQHAAQLRIAADASDELKRLANSMDPPKAPATDTGKGRGKPPSLPSTGPDHTDQLLRKALESETKAIKAAAEERKLALDFANDQAEGAYRDGLTALERYFAQQADIRQQGLAAELEALDKESQALKKYRDRVQSPVSREDADNKIAELASRRAQAIQKAGYADQKALVDNARAVEQLQDRYADLQATILAAGGDQRGAAQARIDQQVRDAGRLAVQMGKDGAGIQDILRRRLQGEADLAEVQRQQGLLSERAANAEERALLAAQARGAGELETYRAVGAARQEALAGMKALADQAQRIAEELKTPEAAAFADRLKLAYERAAAAADPVLQHLRDLGGQVGDTIASGLADAALSGGDLLTSLKNIDRQLAQIAMNELFTKPLKNWLTNAIGGNGQASGGGGWLGSLLGTAGSGGGNAAGGTSIWSSIGSWLSGLASYDVGTSYVPEDMVAKIHKGERIVPASENKPGYGGMTLVVNQQFAPGTDKSTINQAARELAAAQRRAMRFR